MKFDIPTPSCKYYHKINIFVLCSDCEKGSDFRGFPRQFVQNLFSAFRSLQRLLPDAAPSAQDHPWERVQQLSGQKICLRRNKVKLFFHSVIASSARSSDQRHSKSSFTGSLSTHQCPNILRFLKKIYFLFFTHSTKFRDSSQEIIALHTKTQKW